MRLDGKVVLIAGASGALGQSVTPAVAQVGAVVVAVDRHPTPSVHHQIVISADATDEAAVTRLVEEVNRKTGPIDVLMNLIGGFAMGQVSETDTVLWHRMFAMNATPAFVLSKAVLPHMLERRTGRIIHLAARAAVEPFPGAAAYIAAKAALVAFIRALSLEIAGSGVTVNGVLPATMDTAANRKAMPDADTSKWVKPASIAELLILLAAEEARHINGTLISIG